MPRSMIATLPEAPPGTLAQPLEPVSNRPKDVAGNGSKSPTAAPIVVPPLAGYVNGWPTKCWFVLAATVITLRAGPATQVCLVRGRCYLLPQLRPHPHRWRYQPNRKQIIVAMIAAAKRQVKNVHSILDCRVNGVQNVFAARVQQPPGKTL